MPRYAWRWAIALCDLAEHLSPTIVEKTLRE